MSLNIIKSIGHEKQLRWEIVKILSANNPGYNFAVNPKEISEELLLNGFEATPIDVGHALKHMGFCEVMTSGKKHRTIYIKLLKELEYQMVGDDINQIEKVKPTLVYIYYKGYDVLNKAMRKYHDKIPEPIRLKIGKWYCQTSKDEINIYIEKCKAEKLISKKVLED